MATDMEPLPGAIEPPPVGDRLDSWKEIAAYLRRDITTVRRWEKREGLPVHRHLHERRDSVYAFTAEVDAWWRGRRGELANGDTTNGAASAPTHRVVFGRETLAWSLAGIGLAAALILAWPASTVPDAGRERGGRRFQFTIVPPDDTTITAASLSPDGDRVAFTTVPRSGPTLAGLLWVQRLDEPRARSIPDTEGAQFPFWSPRADAVGFFSEGRLWTVAFGGGAPTAIAEAPVPRGGTWNANDVIVFAPSREGPLYQVPAAGGQPVAVTTVDRPSERGHVWPSFLPDGRRFLYLADSIQREGHNVFVGSLLDSSRTRVVEGGRSNAVFTAGGSLIFGRDRQLVAQRVDPNHLTPSGDPLVIADSLQESGGHDHLHDFAVTSGDVIVYRRRQSAAVHLVWRDRDGRRTRLAVAPDDYMDPMLSPDETRIGVDLFFRQPSRRFGYGSSDIRSDIVMLEGATAARSTFVEDPGAEWGPLWSPDGRHVVYSSNVRDRTLELYRRSSTGDGDVARVLAVDKGNPVPQSWSPDGRFLLYELFDPKTHSDLWLLPMTGEGRPEPLLRGDYSEMQGQISPDGRWLAYSSDESGRLEVYVQPFRRAGPKRRISTDGGGDPRWGHDGRELYYIGADRRLMSVAVELAPGFDARAPVALFDTGMPPQWYEARNLYDVSRDGRFLFMEPVEDDRAMPLTVLVNWLPR